MAFVEMNGWKLVARTDVRTSLQKEATGETVEILYHDNFADKSDVHSIMYSPSPKAESFYSLNAGGLFSIDYSAVRVSPPPTLSDIAKLERPVGDSEAREKFFEKVSEAAFILPKRAQLEEILATAANRKFDSRMSGIPADISILDLACANGERLRTSEYGSEGWPVGVDLRPPIIGDDRALFFRSAPFDFLITLRQRQIQPQRINADFLLSTLRTSADQTGILEEIMERLAPDGVFTFCETVASAKRIVATLKMLPGLEVRGKGFAQTREWLSKTPLGRREVEKFLQAHPGFETSELMQGKKQEKRPEVKMEPESAQNGDGGNGKSGEEENGFENRMETGEEEVAAEKAAEILPAAPKASEPAVSASHTVPANMPVLVEVTKT